VRITVIANALPPPKEVFLRSCRESDLVLAADGGANFCRDLGITPHWIIGDLDSISASNLDFFQSVHSIVYRFPVEKDETDLELALKQAVRLGADKIHLFSWADERVDYSLGTLFVVNTLSVPIELYTQRAHVFVVNRKSSPWRDSVTKFKTNRGKQNRKISIFPLIGPVTLKTKGLKWNLNWRKGDSVQRISQSNEIIGKEAEIHCKSGAIFIVVDASARPHS